MKGKTPKRVTIYHIAAELGISPTAVSNALNDKRSVSQNTKTLVLAKARELNYRHNSNASNLRRGITRTIGVVVPKINTAFFADAISGIEEVCYEHNYRVIICQSGESFTKEVQAIETLIEYNVDCVIISLSKETKSVDHLRDAIGHGVKIIQFDRVDSRVDGYSIVNDNKDAAYAAVRHLVDSGCSKIALLGGPNHVTPFRKRKEGYIQAIEESSLVIPYNYLVDDVTTLERGTEVAKSLLESSNRPDAFFAMSDHAALGALRAALSLGFKVPQEVAIIGFANEVFSDLISPGISSIDQNSREMGRQAASVYFNQILNVAAPSNSQLQTVVQSALIIRDSSRKTLL